jgi:hypothetical protein
MIRLYLFSFLFFLTLSSPQNLSVSHLFPQYPRSPCNLFHLLESKEDEIPDNSLSTLTEDETNDTGGSEKGVIEIEEEERDPSEFKF